MGTTFLISSASRLQRLPEATRNSVLTCLRSQFSARTPSMSSRKSARISAASLEAKENAVPEQTTKNVNASRKRKNPATEAAPSSKEKTSSNSCSTSCDPNSVGNWINSCTSTFRRYGTSCCKSSCPSEWNQCNTCHT